MVAILYMTVFCAVSPIGEFEVSGILILIVDDDNDRGGCGNGTDKPGRGGGDGNKCTGRPPGHQHCDHDDNDRYVKVLDGVVPKGPSS